ncbi:hypothetical protein RZE82_00030 [Mollicutes bacterium LVI A0039]|nr:hypothetical protein RZE82_00030 [Mollicutes bacterium LVI A0039]
MRTEIIKGIISIVLTLIIVMLGGLSTPLESYTNTTSLIFSNKELIMLIFVFIVFILKNIKLSMIIYSTRQVTPAYLFFFLNNTCINLLLILMLLETNKISLLIAGILTIGELIISSTLLLAGGFLSKVHFSSRNIRVKEFLGLITIMLLIIDGMPFVLSSWPVATVVLIVYIIYMVNLSFNNLHVVIKEL